MDFRRTIRLVAIVFLVATVTVPGVGAASADAVGEDPTVPIETSDVDVVTAVQDDGADNESDDSHWIGPGGSDDNESDDEGGNESGGGGEDGGDDGGIVDSVTDGASSVADSLNPASSIQSPEETMEDIWQWIAERAYEAMIFLVDTVFNNLLGTPRIVNDGLMDITGTPVDDGTVSGGIYADLYESVYLPFIIPTIASVISLMALMVLIGPAISAITRRRMFSALGSAALVVFLIVASWEFAALLHAISDEMTQFFLPTGEEVVAEERTMVSGPLAAVVGLYVTGGGSAVTLLLIHGIRHMMLYMAPIVLPALILMAYWGGARKVKQVGSFFVWQYYGLLVWNWPTAVLLRIAYELNWTFHSSELINLSMTMAVFFVAVTLPLLVSGSFGLIGISMRGAAAATATTALGNVRSRTPAPSVGGSGTTRRNAMGRLKRGGARAGLSAKNRAQAAYSRSRWGGSPTSTPRSGTPNNWNPNEKTGATRTHSRHRSNSVSPNQRRRAVSSRTRRSNTAD